jgi:large subunit ribosomal protein L22
MEVRATGKYLRVQPRKVRIVADELRGKPAAHAAALLRYHPSKSARMLRKVLVSAISNAQENHGVSPEALRISAIVVDAGPRIKRIQARAMGRAYRIEKKTSHITVTVEEYEGEQRVKPHGTKPKARPSFAGLAKAAAKKKKAEEPAPEETAAASEAVEQPVEESMAAESAVETTAEESGVAAAEEIVAEEAPAEEPPAEEPPADEPAPEVKAEAEVVTETEPNADSDETTEKPGEA